MLLRASKDVVALHKNTKLIERKAIQDRARQRLRSESLLLEEFDTGDEVPPFSNGATGIDIGALISQYDTTKLASQLATLDASPAKSLTPVPWTIEAVRTFFLEKCPLLRDVIQFIDLRHNLHSPAQWMVVAPIPNERQRISVCEEFTNSFKNPPFSQLCRHGDPKTDPWILFDLRSIYVNIMTPEESERLDLASLWDEDTRVSVASITTPTLKETISPQDDPNYLPKKIQKLAQKLEHQNHKAQMASLSKSTKKKLRHFKSYPVVSLRPSSISMRSQSEILFFDKQRVERIDKRYVLEGQFKELKTTTEDLPDVDEGNDETDVSSQRSNDYENSLAKSQFAVLKGRNRAARRYRKALQKHIDELETLSHAERL